MLKSPHLNKWIHNSDYSPLFLSIEKEYSQATFDSVHDQNHSFRVLQNCLKILSTEKGDELSLVLASLLHDIKNYPKDHPERKFSSQLSAEYAQSILKSHGVGTQCIELVYDCILNHSFSRGHKPETHEGEIFQDADRLDALGAIGLGRCFSLSGHFEGQIYHPTDPFYERERLLEDTKYAIDHFYNKLFHLPKLMNTRCGAEMAYLRVKRMEMYLEWLKDEITGGVY